MTEKIKNFFSKYGLDGILLIALGIFMMIWPKASLKLICIIIGIILIILGLAKLIQHFSPKYQDEDKSAVPVSIVELIVGIALIVASSFFIKIFPVIAGIIILLGCIMMFMKAYNFRKIKDSNFYSSIVVGIVLLIIGIIMIVNPVGSISFIVRMTGIGLIILGIYMIIATRRKNG